MANPDCTELAEWIRRSKRILIFTGAGISTDSGIPDFRGPNGVWKNRAPVYLDDFLSSEASRIEHWDYKLEGWEGFRNAQPNAIHTAIVQLEKVGKLRAVLTQNIDGLHGAAGTNPECLIEIHGTNLWIECLDCGTRSKPAPHFEAFAATRQPPVCDCGGFLKPATISFGQSLRAEDLTRAEAASSDCDLVVSLGSTLSVHPAASFPLLASQSGVPYIIINRGETDQDSEPGVVLRIDDSVAPIFPDAVALAIQPK